MDNNDFISSSSVSFNSFLDLLPISIQYFRLTIKFPVISSDLLSSRIINLLFQNLTLSSDTIFYIVKYLFEHPIENQTSTTNFEDID